MMTREYRGAVLPATPEIIAELESWAPEGWKFLRATQCSRSANHGKGIRVFFAKKPPSPRERRPKVRLLSKVQLGAFDKMMLKYVAANYVGCTWEDVVLDTIVHDAEIRRLFNLGDKVSIRGVRTHWDPPHVEVEAMDMGTGEVKKQPIKSTRRTKHGKCVGFSIRVVN